MVDFVDCVASAKCVAHAANHRPRWQHSWPQSGTDATKFRGQPCNGGWLL